MSFREQADITAQAVAEALGVTPTQAQAKAAADVIEQAIIDSYRDAAERCAKVALDCCAEDRDLAHKVSDQIKRANTALIANLSSLR
jgi:hypothetical protein